jgi:hypothetical protein
LQVVLDVEWVCSHLDLGDTLQGPSPRPAFKVPPLHEWGGDWQAHWLLVPRPGAVLLEKGR